MKATTNISLPAKDRNLWMKLWQILIAVRSTEQQIKIGAPLRNILIPLGLHTYPSPFK